MLVLVIDVTGAITSTGNLTISNAAPTITFTDSDADDYLLQANGGAFIIYDATANATRLAVNDDGTVDIHAHCDINQGLDVTGAITGTGDMTIDTNTLHVDSSNNRVGIGTASPVAPLHVAHSGTSTAVGTNFISLRSGASGRDIGIQFADGATSAYVGMLGGAIYFADSGSSEKMRIDSSGRLLLGTTTEGSTIADDFTINTASGNGGITVRTDSSSVGSLLFSDSTSGTAEYAGFIQYDHNQNHLILGSNSSETMHLDESGNVGIGTNSPNTKLEIAGSTTNTLNLSDGQVQIVGNNPIAFVAQSNLNPALNRWGFKVRANSTEGSFSIYDYANSRHSLLLDSSGRVGIGTTSPSYKNQISVVDTTAYSASTISANQFQLAITNTGAAGVAGLLFVTEPSSGNGGHCGIRALSTGSGNSALTFSTRGSNTQAERMRIDSSGSVNIGSTGGFDSNGDDLTITNSSHGGISIKTGTTSDGVIRFGDGSGANEYRGYINYRHNGDKFLIGTSGLQRLSVDSDGLKFGSDTAAANALDDYEEGTFTPNYNTTASNLTLNGTSSSSASVYHARKGSYVKIGKRVWFQISLATNGLTSVGGSDFIALDGLPFTAENDSNRPRFVMACQAGRFDTTNTFVPLFLVVNPGTTLCQLRQDFDTQKTINSFNVTGSSNRNVIEAFGSYEVA